MVARKVGRQRSSNNCRAPQPAVSLLAPGGLRRPGRQGREGEGTMDGFCGGGKQKR